MKRFLLLVLALTMLAGMAYAQEKLGLTVGAGVGIPVLNTEDGQDMDMELIIPKVIYENDLTDEMGIYVELEVLMSTNDDVEDLGAKLEIEFNYNINEAMTFFLKSNTELPFGDASPVGEYNDKLEGVLSEYLTPGFRYNLMGDMPMWFRLDVPLYIAGGGDAMDYVDLDFTYNLNRLRDKEMTPDTWGVELKANMHLSAPEETMEADNFLSLLTITPYYEMELLYGELEIVLPLYEDGMDTTGLTITPKVDINIPNVEGLALELALPITNLGADKDKGGDDMRIGLGLLVKYSF
jgi:hypothetical protein